MTAIEMARLFFPTQPEDEVSWILWNRTAFPFGDCVTWLAQLRTYWWARQLGRDVCSCCGKIRTAKQMTRWDLCIYGERRLFGQSETPSSS